MPAVININENDFRRLDLNLLLVFSALMRERSVTQAARRLFIGQPALSAALARLRAFAGDELFLRTAHGMEPTARALELAEALKPVMEGLSSALFSPGGFDPASSDRTFELGMFDIGEVTLAPLLLGELGKQAPAVRVALHPVDRNDAATRLESGDIDLAITDLATQPSWMRSQRLYQERFACMFNPKLVKAALPISMADYLSHPHLLTTFSPGFSGFVDEALAARRLARRVTMTTSRFATLPFVLQDFAGIAALPATAAHALGPKLGLSVSPLPVEVPPVDLMIAWHARHENDPGHRWFRELVARIAVELNKAIVPKAGRATKAPAAEARRTRAA